MTESSEHNELIELTEKFFKAEISDDYLRERLENPVSSDPGLWIKLLELGFYEYFGEVKREDQSLSLIGKIARECGRVPIPESLVEGLFTGPVLFSLLSSKEVESIEKFLGKEKVEAVLSGTNSISFLPPLSSSNLSIKKGKAAGDLTGVINRADTVGCFAVVGETLYLIDTEKAKDVSPERNALDRLLPRSVLQLKNAPTLTLEVSADEVLAVKRLVLASELLGMANACIDLTVEYVSDRKQFGVSIGCFQAVKHPLADKYLQARELEALLRFFGGMLDRGDPQYKALSLVTLSAALSRVPSIIEKCIQLHGGIGFTWEYVLHLYLRRAKSYEALFRLSAEDNTQICTLSAAL